ncbi:MAG: NAD-dependent epimerase/dehydratase family protein, partial [Patescibacteria group bacterium]|nr:NAD-dependent epimerase/dehydratase family protein [Patescibacteria group bacterium]
SQLCDELIKTCKVICLDNFSTGDERNIDHLLADPNFMFIRHDMALPIDLEKLSELQKFKIQFQGIQEIYNLACPMSPKDFDKNKIANILANSYGVKNALDLALKYEAKFMQFSSSVVYGPRQGENKKIKESELGILDMLSARSSYDEGKRFAETIVQNYKDVYGIKTKIIRIFRTYGPRMMLDDDQMIPDFIRDALDNKDLNIFGDKNFSSSFCYVSDTVDAVIKMMESDSAGPLNIGSDMDINLTDLAQKIINIVGSKSKIAYVPEKLFMTPLGLPDITAAREELGWMPVVTLEKGLKKSIDDLRASKGLKGVRQAI